LDRSVGLALAPAAGAGGLVEGPVVDGFAELDLPGLRETSGGVPSVKSDDVVADVGDGEEQTGGDKPGLSEEPSVDVQGLVAGRAEQSFNEGAAVEGLGPAGALPGQALAVAFLVDVFDDGRLRASARLALDARGGGEVWAVRASAMASSSGELSTAAVA